MATIYFNNETGNNSNGGTSPADAYKDYTKFGSITPSGDDILDFATPTGFPYAVICNPSWSGTSGHPIVLRANTTHGWKCDGNGASSSGIGINGKNYVRFQGAEVTGFRGTGGAIDLSGSPGNLRLGGEAVDCNVHDNARYQIPDLEIEAGIVMNYTQSGVVDGCTVTDERAKGGIRMKGSVSLSIVDSVILRINGDGINGPDSTGLRCTGTRIQDAVNALGSHADALSFDSIADAIFDRCLISNYTQLMYCATGDNPNSIVDGLSLFNSILYTENYGDGTGANGAPGFFIANASQATSSFSGIRIVNCTFGYCGLKAVILYAQSGTGDDIIIRNNIFYKVRGSDTGSDTMEITGCTNVSSDFNRYYDCPKAAFDGANSVANSDPLFVNYTGWSTDDSAYDFDIQAGSPCIGAGDSNLGTVVTLPSPFLDYAGVNRGSAPHDIGAYEYAAAETGVSWKRT